MADFMRSAYFLVFAVVASFVAGVLMTADHYEDKLTQQELDAAIARAEQGKRSYEKLVEAQNGLEAWRASAESMSAELERVRSAKRTVRTSADTCGVERAAVARCEGLLERSADTVARCSDLLQRDAAIHDAVIGAVK